jgi:hypothetical protein
MNLSLLQGLLCVYLTLNSVSLLWTIPVFNGIELASSEPILLDESQLQDIRDSLLQVSNEIRNLKQESNWYESSITGVVLGAFLGAGLSAIGGRVSKYQTDEKAKIQLSYQIMKEWDDLRQDRNAAYEIFVVSDNGSDKRTAQDMLPFSNYSADERVHMNRVLEFFDRLDLLHRQQLIDEKVVVEYLSQDYQQWEEDYFSKQRGIETDPTFTYAFKEPYKWLLP